MKIGFYVQRVASGRGFEKVVSAHVQLPVQMMCLLMERGHEVELITTEFGEDRALPDCIPEGVVVHQVPYGSAQGTALVMDTGPKNGIRPLTLLRQIWKLKSLSNSRGYDILHLSGGEGIAMIGGALRVAGLRAPVVLSLNYASLSGRLRSLRRFLWKRIAKVTTSTEFLREAVAPAGIECDVLRHGIVKELPEPSSGTNKTRVLFWRDPDPDNGADVCVEAFAKLAPRFPEFSFDFAVRPHWDRVDGIDELCEREPNANLFEFPYPEGVTIEGLISEAICIVLPFRHLSTNPQWAIMESVLAGVPTVTTDVESNPELFGVEEREWTTPVGDVSSTVKAIESILSSPKAALEQACRERNSMQERWTWDGFGEKLESVYQRST